MKLTLPKEKDIWLSPLCSEGILNVDSEYITTDFYGWHEFKCYNLFFQMLYDKYRRIR